MVIKSAKGLEKILIERLPYLIGRVKTYQCTGGDVYIIFCYDNLIYEWKIKTPTYYCINEKHIEECIEYIRKTLNDEKTN